MKHSILIVEDNIITAKHIANSLKKFGYQIAALVNSLEGVQKELAKSIPDLVILDINLGRDIDGINIAEILEKEFQIPFIFLTSYNDESTINRIIKLKPLGYIIKPFNPVDLNGVVELAIAKIVSIRKLNTIKSQDGNLKKDSIDDFFFIKNGRKIEKVAINEIDFIRVEGRYTYIYSNGSKKICNSNLKSLKERLDEINFIQIHKSYIVNLTKIDTITFNSIIIESFELPVSKNFRTELISKLKLV
jgi:DNA-binding LytR/AlgR family response regulator